MSGLIRPGWSLRCYLQGWTQREAGRNLHPVSNQKGIGMTWGKGIDPSLQINPLVASETSLMWQCCWNHLRQDKNSQDFQERDLRLLAAIWCHLASDAEEWSHGNQISSMHINAMFTMKAVMFAGTHLHTLKLKAMRLFASWQMRPV